MLLIRNSLKILDGSIIKRIFSKDLVMNLVFLSLRKLALELIGMELEIIVKEFWGVFTFSRILSMIRGCLMLENWDTFIRRKEDYWFKMIKQII